MNQFAAIIISLSILLLSYAFKKISGSWSTPSSGFCLFWFLFSFLPLIGLWGLPINPLSLLYIFFACAAFSGSAVFFDWQKAWLINKTLSPSRKIYFSNIYVLSVFLVSTTLSAAFILLDARVQGLSLSGLISNFFENSNLYMQKRYEGDVKSNIFGQWGLIFGYVSIAFGAMYYAPMISNIKSKFFLVSVMLTPTLIMMIQAAKGMFFLAMAMIFGICTIYRVLNGIHPHVDFKQILRNSKYIIFVAPLVLLSFLSRGLHALDDEDLVKFRLLQYLFSYAFLHVYSFSDWFSSYLGDESINSYAAESLTLGFYTFISTFKLLGSSREVLPGVYTEYFQFGDVNPGNIYTIFRGLITDFGLFGSMVFLFIFGSVFNFFYYRLLVYRFSALGMAAYLLFVNMTYTSYIISTFIWNSTMLVAVLYATLLTTNLIYVNRLQLKRA